jgi:uncharacterized MAPEG superfamily protein
MEIGPGVGAVGVLLFSLMAKLYMSFCLRISEKANYSPPEDELKKKEFKERTQLNVAEYEAMFIAVFLYLHYEKAESMLLTIVAIATPLSQAAYFWGRMLTGTIIPFTFVGALPRYACMGICIYLVYQTVTKERVKYGPGLAACVTMTLSLLAKLFMSFAFNAMDLINGPPDTKQYELSKKDQEANNKLAAPTPAGVAEDLSLRDTAKKAQLNVKEYEAMFVTIFLFFHVHGFYGSGGMFLSYAFPSAQAIYFLGRVIPASACCQGCGALKRFPYNVVGALTRYICLAVSIWCIYDTVARHSMRKSRSMKMEGQLRLPMTKVPWQFPGLMAAVIILESLAAKMVMSGVRFYGEADTTWGKLCSRSQLNVAEYEDLFVAIFLFCFLEDQLVDDMVVTVVAITVPIAQAIYFYGRVATGNMMPWSPLGALPRYISMAVLIYVLSHHAQIFALVEGQKVES